MAQTLRLNQYKMKNVSVESLEALGFQYSRTYSADSDKYIKEFPVYKNGCKPVLFARLIVDCHSGDTQIDCFDDKGCTYAPFYQAVITNNNVVTTINKKIVTKLKQCNIKKVA